jgi:hypothetical protein
MQVDAGAVLTGGALVLGGVVWLVRLEGRVNMTAAIFERLEKRLEVDLKEIKDDVKAIRENQP